jgi:hypothetical protein
MEDGGRLELGRAGANGTVKFWEVCGNVGLRRIELFTFELRGEPFLDVLRLD